MPATVDCRQAGALRARLAHIRKPFLFGGNQDPTPTEQNKGNYKTSDRYFWGDAAEHREFNIPEKRVGKYLFRNSTRAWVRTVTAVKARTTFHQDHIWR